MLYIFAFLICTPCRAHQVEKLIITANDEELNFQTSPITVNGHAMVPVRQTAEKFGISVRWNDVSQEVTLSKDGKNFTMKIGESKALLGSQTAYMPAEAMLVNKTTMAPLRFVFEFFGKEVNYEDFGPRGLHIWITDFKLLPDDELVPDDRYVSESNFYVLKEGQKTKRGIGIGDSLSSVESLYGLPAKKEDGGRLIYYFGKYEVNTSSKCLVFTLDKNLSQVEKITLY